MTHKLASLGSLIRMQGIELAGAPRTAAVMHPRRHSSHPAALDDAGALEREVSDRHLLQSGAFVGGAFVHPASGAAFEVLNPATGGRLARVSDCGGPETRAAIAAAAAAFGPWAARPARERAAALRRWHDAAWAARDDLARLITLECGKPLAEARSEVDTGLASIRWFAEEAPRVAGEVLSPPARATRFLVLRQPVGVVAAITPWNFPFSMITRKVAPALAAGCTVVCKPSELAPLTALALAALAARAGLPPGVLNMVPAAAGDAFRREVMASEAVRKVSFTGSTRVGKALYAAAAGTVKRLSLELGGNAPFVVFDDADVAKAARDVVASSCRNAGQTCICTNRVLVQEGVHDEFVAAVVERASSLRLGSGLAPGTTHGPLISAAARGRVEAKVVEAVGQGARVALGGGRPALDPGAGLDGGFFYQPTVLLDASPAMRVVSEELFGPVTPITRFASEEEALRLANATPAGLAAFFYSRDLGRAFRFAERLECGMVGVNETGITADVAPFGGVKESGLGREQSRHGIGEYLEMKTVALGVGAGW